MKKNTYNFFCNLKIAIVIGLMTLAGGRGIAQELKWAADTESGAPYVFFNPQNPTQMTGFEYDIVQGLAQKLKLKPVFVQNAWEGLILGLDRGEYDIAINGIEITDDRKKAVLFSDPYYATFLQIVVRQNETRFKDLPDLQGHKVGTVAGALSERILRAEQNIEVLPYESEANAHQDLLMNRSDALFFDAPIAKYYSEVDPRFRILPTPIGAMTYGIAISKKKADLHRKINQALHEMIESGELRKIYERWALWNSATAVLFNDPTPARLAPVEFENYKNNLNLNRPFSEKLSIYKKTFPILLSAAGRTIQISFLAMILAVLGGLMLVSLRLYGGVFIRTLVISFIELIRGTPLLLQLFFIFYALTSLGIEF
jgi:polar amino acid transport system substrate-binding protein